ncbi:MAG: PAS domain S-box protein [Thermodesulfovibrionales bacterium]|nr:PAS domain S-box protein [Thermodesulfovibrionales bacterium]
MPSGKGKRQGNLVAVMKTEQKVIAGSIIFGLLNWVMDSVLDYFFFYEESFLNLLILDVPANEMFLRSASILWFFMFGVFISMVISKRKRAEESLAEGMEILQTITDTARDAIITIDHYGNISFWNPAAESVFGYKKEEAVGKELHSLIVPYEYYEAYGAGFKGFRETGKGPAVGKTLELMAVRKNGTEFPVELSLATKRIKGRWHATGIIRDITGRKRAEEELKAHRSRLSSMVEERTAELIATNKELEREIAERRAAEEAMQASVRFFSMIFDSIRDPFNIIDSDYRIVRVNEAYAQLKWKKIEELVGRRCYEVLHGRGIVCDGCVVEKTFNSGDPCAKDKQVLGEGGVDAWVEIYTYPIFDRDLKVSHVIEYVRDITDRKKSEAEGKRLRGA